MGKIQPPFTYEARKPEDISFACFVGERWLDLAHVVCSDCDQCPAAANVEVQLSLKFNETLVSNRVEFHAAEDCAYHVRADLSDLWMHSHGDGFSRDHDVVVGVWDGSLVHHQCPR